MTIWFCLMATLAGPLQPGMRAQEVAPSEYQLKAAFLYNFAKFVEWPAGTFKGPGSEFIIGIAGENPFGDALGKSVKGKAINGHPLVVRELASPADARGCHIVFIGSSEKKRLGEYVKTLEQRPVLTVSEVDRFMQRGLMVNFFMEGNKVRFEINHEAAKKVDLRISSKLLNLARQQEAAR